MKKTIWTSWFKGRKSAPPLVKFASLKVSTENLGDHIQIISGLRLLSRLGIEPTRYIDRDNEIQSAPGLDEEDGPVGILLNGWFKTNRAEWPPHPKLVPLIYGIHIRPNQCPELLSDASVDFFRRHQPIGCRDVYTENLLRSKGVEAFTSNCLSLTLPRRIDDPETQTEVFVVSRDERIRTIFRSRSGPTPSSIIIPVRTTSRQTWRGRRSFSKPTVHARNSSLRRCCIARCLRSPWAFRLSYSIRSTTRRRTPPIAKDSHRLRALCAFIVSRRSKASTGTLSPSTSAKSSSRFSIASTRWRLDGGLRRYPDGAYRAVERVAAAVNLDGRSGPCGKPMVEHTALPFDGEGFDTIGSA